MKRKAIIYARFSTVEQAKGYSLERQISNGKKYIEAMGWEFSGALSDEGLSAFHGVNRQEGAALHRFEYEAKQGLHQGVILCVENTDRLTRMGIRAATTLIWGLNDAGVDVATWHDRRFYTSDSKDELVDLFSIALPASRGHDESNTKHKRAVDFWQKRYAEIAAGSKTPMEGYYPAWIEIVDNEYKLINHRVAVLNEIYDLYIAGYGITKIIQILNSREEPVWQINGKNTEGGWYPAYIHRLLTKRTVMGEYLTLKGEVISSDHYPQAVTTQKFLQAQAVRGNRRISTNPGSKRANNLLSGLVICSSCEGTAGYENKGNSSTTPYTNKKGETVRYKRKHYEKLRCDRNRRKRECDNSHLFDYKIIESAVLDRMLELTIDDEPTNSKVLALTDQIAEATRAHGHAQQQLNNLIDALADGGSKALMQRVTSLEVESDRLGTLLVALKKDLTLEAARPPLNADADLVCELRSQLNSDDDEVRFHARTQVNMALKRIIEKVFITSDGTFTVLADIAVWQFDKDGQFLTGQAL